jgi:hypothetical protein
VPRTGTANLPLHGGRAPRWLFERMRRLARGIVIAVVADAGPEEVLRRLSDPFWFQALGCVLGFDWHSSGVTTTVCGAVKEGMRDLEGELGLFVCGGKGRASRRTPAEIEERGGHTDADPSALVYASRMSAKVDSSAVQDGFQVYHHAFFFTRGGAWCVVQQGMNERTGTARRYHWLSSLLTDFVNEPHAAVACDTRSETLNLVARESGGARGRIAELAREKPVRILTEIKRVRSLSLPSRHHIAASDIDPRRLATTFLSTYERQPAGFEEVLGIPGVGPKTLRALALLSEIIYGEAASFRDPARFAFAHGGKDGHPFPVDRETYDGTISFLKGALARAKLGRSDRLGALRRLGGFERGIERAFVRPEAELESTIEGEKASNRR